MEIIFHGNLSDQITKSYYIKPSQIKKFTFPVTKISMTSLFILLVLNLFISCYDFETKNKTNNSRLTGSEVIIDESEIDTFYKEFRNALLNSDMEKISSMTNFPLEVWGFEDRDPRISISHKDFATMLSESLSYGGRL